MIRPASTSSSPHRRYPDFGVKTLQAMPCSPLFLLLFLLLSPIARAATLTADGITCTLADAIVAANTDTATGGCPAGDPGADTIQLDADVTLSSADANSIAFGGVSAGLPDVTDDVTIAAGAASIIRRDPAFTCDAMTADPVFRFLQLESGALTLDGLTFEGGCFVASDELNLGGGIFAALDTELTLTDVTVSDFDAISTSGPMRGGFLFSAGSRVTVTGGVFDALRIQASGSLRGGAIYLENTLTAATIDGAVFSNLTASSGSSSLQGGAIDSRTDLTLEDATFSNLMISSPSSLQGGGLYTSSSADLVSLSRSSFDQMTVISGSSLQGGAVYSSADQFLIADVILSNVDAEATNTCTGAAVYANNEGPFERLIVEDNVCRSLTSGVEGAGARLLGNGTVLRDCVFRRNESRAHGRARGGAIFASSMALIERCAFLDNSAISEASVDGLDARGGALSIGEVTSMRNVTIAGNLAQAADGVGLALAGGTAEGGGLSLTSSSEISVLSAVTITANRAIAGVGDTGFLDGEALGGGIFVNGDHTAEVIGSILSDNLTTDALGDTTNDCFAEGTLLSQGYNVAENPGGSCPFDAFGDITGLDPGLYPVADYGCATTLPDGSCVPTAAIDQSSWATDWSSCTDAGISRDSRDLERPQDIVGVLNLIDGCDAGAFEARDSDGDGITDVPDLCPLDSDPDQADSDDDQVGDACDACAGDDASGDNDGDFVCDDFDLCPGFDDLADVDNDGVPDGCDACQGDDASGDTDGDFVCDDSDLCDGSDDLLDADNDGVPDGCDICDGDDASGDSDGDGLCDDSDAAVGDRVWLDDGNGIQDGGEPGVAAVTVHLYTAAGQLLETTSTDGDGRFGFSPGPGDFYLEFVRPAGMALAPQDQGVDEAADSDADATTGTTSVFTLALGQVELRVDAGLEPAVIGDRVWDDANGDGRQQPTEIGIAGVAIRLLDASDAEVAATTSGADGLYQFLGIASGTYRIEVQAPVDAFFSAQDVGSNDLIDSDVDAATGRSPLFTYVAATAARSWDAGLQFIPLFADGFESGDLSGWSTSEP